MDLEEELKTLESTSNFIPSNNNLNNENVTLNNVNQNQTMQEQTINNIQPTQQFTQNQPAMTNLNAAQQQVADFNYSSLEFDINKPLYERNPLERLVGDKGQTFRIHLLPDTNPNQVHVHWDADKGHNFVCLKDVYNTQGEKCCGTHEQAKLRIVIPVIVYSVSPQNPNQLTTSTGQLKTLILGYKQFEDLKNQAELAGIPLVSGDIFASVDNPQYKSFNFTVVANSFISQLTNVADLIALWKQVGTPKNICGAAGRVITREEYEAAYSSYDANMHKQYNTPTSGGQLGNNSFTINTPQGFNSNGFNQQPFYNGQQSNTVTGFNTTQSTTSFDGNTSPWN